MQYILFARSRRKKPPKGKVRPMGPGPGREKIAGERNDKMHKGGFSRRRAAFGQKKGANTLYENPGPGISSERKSMVPTLLIHGNPWNPWKSMDSMEIHGFHGNPW